MIVSCRWVVRCAVCHQIIESGIGRFPQWELPHGQCAPERVEIEFSYEETVFTPRQDRAGASA